MILNFFILLLYVSVCSSDNADVESHNHLKIVGVGDSVYFTCVFPKESRSSMVWVKQRVGEKPLPIVSSYQSISVHFKKDFDKPKRFFVEKDDTSFNLSITNTEESDTATYYCIIYVFDFKFGNSTDLIVKDGPLDVRSGRPATDPVYPADSTVGLQCAVVTQSCAAEHNVYWFRHESGESPPGIIYTQDSGNGQCERSDVNSTTRKCIYNLPERKEDAGIYYCAVAACGEILFGDGRHLPGSQAPWNTIALILALSNSLSVIVIIFLGTKLYKNRRKDGTRNIQIGHLMDEDRNGLNYAALSFQQKPSTSRRPREKHIR